MKATVAPGPPSFTSFSNSAPLRGSFRRWRKLLAVGVSTLDLALLWIWGREWLSEGSSFSKAQQLTPLSVLSSGFPGRPGRRRQEQGGTEKVPSSGLASPKASWATREGAAFWNGCWEGYKELESGAEGGETACSCCHCFSTDQAVVQKLSGYWHFVCRISEYIP